MKNTPPIRKSERSHRQVDRYGSWRAHCAIIEHIEEIIQDEIEAIAFKAVFDMENMIIQTAINRP